MNNIERIKGVLDQHGLDAMLVTGMSTRRYASGFPSSAGALIVTKTDAYFFVDSCARARPRPNWRR